MRKDEPAFPTENELHNGDHVLSQRMQGGLTKREYFAGLAMQGALPHWYPDNADADAISKMAVECADALIKALEQAEK